MSRVLDITTIATATVIEHWRINVPDTEDEATVRQLIDEEGLDSVLDPDRPGWELREVENIDVTDEHDRELRTVSVDIPNSWLSELGS